MRIEVDIGGTFTDVALERSGPDGRDFVTAKTPTTPSNPVSGATDSVRLALAKASTSTSPQDVRAFIHGTTLATQRPDRTQRRLCSCST